MPSIAESKTIVVFNENYLWHLATGTTVREIGKHGRTFVADARTPGVLWYGPKYQHRCPVHALELPVEVGIRD